MPEVLTRDRVPAARKWDLSAIMTEAEIPALIEEVKSGCEELRAFSGKMTPENALEILRKTRWRYSSR